MAVKRNVVGRPPTQTPKAYRVTKDGVEMVRLHVYLPMEVMQWVDIESRRTNKSRSETIQRCINEAVFR